ncbi:MAG: hypothetical protein KC652_12465, partial [Cyanobacteria bacterium HKST-UBA01]|nr:hypothetical protein [Cyanobacteria bacterium HKST-UBA01]
MEGPGRMRSGAGRLSTCSRVDRGNNPNLSHQTKLEKIMNTQVSQVQDGKAVRGRPPFKPVNNLGERSISFSDIRTFQMCQLAYR